MREHRGATQGTLNFFSAFSGSDQFEKVFKEGMGLVEETANYLDGQGRVDARALDRPGAIAYATESMRLTTRLMQLASWLLLQRAIAAGEMSEDENAHNKARVNLADIGKGNIIPGAEAMPEGLVELVERSLRLHERILVLDSMINKAHQAEAATFAAANENPVANQINKLARAFAVR